MVASLHTSIRTAVCTLRCRRSVPPQRAEEAVKAGWAVWHPWAKKRPEWMGFVMLYTPQSMAELEVTFQLIVDGYNCVTGKKVHAKDYGREP